MLYRRVLFLLLFILLVAAVGVAAHYHPDWTWAVQHEQEFRDRIADAPIANWCVGTCLYFAFSLIPGTGGKSVIAGWLFGFWAAVAMIELGLTAAAVASFLLGRYAFRELVQRHWGTRLQSLSQRFARDRAFNLLLLRLAHAPFTLINYGAGAVGIPLTTFWWTTHLGILPGTAVFAFIGARIPSLQVVADKGVWALMDLPLIVALIATAVAPLIIRFAMRHGLRWLRKSNNSQSLRG